MSVETPDTSGTGGPTPPESIQGDHAAKQILRRVWRRLNVKNEHWMHVIVGREGSGKSLTAIKIARLIDPTFTADRVLFDPAELLRRLRDGEYEEGQMFVFDESGVGLGNRTWAEKGQVKLNQALQLIRSHNIGLIFTLPRLGELDTQAQGRLHSYYEIGSKEPGEYVTGRWRWLDPDRVDITGKIYRKVPRYDGMKVAEVRITPPDDGALVESYETRKEQFQREFYDEALGELEEDTDDSPDPHEIAEQVLSDGVEEYIAEINNGTQQVLDRDLIAADYDCGEAGAKRAKKILQRRLDREGLL